MICRLRHFRKCSDARFLSETENSAPRRDNRRGTECEPGERSNEVKRLKTDLEVATTVSSARWPEDGNLPVENV